MRDHLVRAVGARSIGDDAVDLGNLELDHHGVDARWAAGRSILARCVTSGLLGRVRIGEAVARTGLRWEQRARRHDRIGSIGRAESR
jgi:hypothetical protein